MLTKQLDQETEKYLAEILKQENTTTDDLIRVLIRDRWLSLHKQVMEHSVQLHSEPHPGQVHPEQIQLEQVLLDGDGNASKQKNNKQAIAEFLKKKRFR
ncbi:MAG: hypothetical protein HC769_32025 [Cyanobacteria bacterium CRU_2_1]|nr:hypothetical protein [Cyanobacteria bacterium RU_5_0]NJR63012.1 hypothetical protein [Cyanobacteria bacterium CRU_2_1]